MVNQTREKIFAILLGICILGIGTATIWMWNISEPKLEVLENRGSEQVAITNPVEGDYTVSMQLGNFTVKDESYSATIITNEDYIIPFSDTRYLVYNDLIGFDQTQLKTARNEIFARRGRIFESEELKLYFESKSWYTPLYMPDQFHDDLLSDIEKENALLIGEYEKLLGY
jgi:hypothetical protein